ncbi:hypothetical protein PsAD26_02579 [Pseudovibrio sp. Ad26]|nr:hypothetical protein PsAD26_02579 [Pseudovibrio sp. Ad26]
MLIRVSLCLALMCSNPAFSANLNDIANRPCTDYVGWVLKFRYPDVPFEAEQEELIEVFSIMSYLRGAHLAFSPRESYRDFEGRFIETCLRNEVFPATQIVAFFMRDPSPS